MKKEKYAQVIILFELTKKNYETQVSDGIWN